MDIYGILVEDIQTIVEAGRVYGTGLEDQRISEITRDLGFVLD